MDTFWAELWGRCAEATDTQAWETIVAADSDPTALALTYTPELAEHCVRLSKIIYFDLAELLDRRGAHTLGYDDHQQLAIEAVAQVEDLYPRARGLLRTALGNDTPAMESFEVWSRERLIVRTSPRAGRLHRLEDRPSVGLLSDLGGHLHVFCLVRPAYRLLEQFAFEPHDREVLVAMQSQPVVAVASAENDSVDLVILSRPEHLEAIRTAHTDGAVSVMVNVSLACLGTVAWRDSWAPVLGRTGVTALFDLVPLRQFELWQQERSTMRYGLVTISGGAAGASMFVCELDGGSYGSSCPAATSSPTLSPST